MTPDKTNTPDPVKLVSQFKGALLLYDPASPKDYERIDKLEAALLAKFSRLAKEIEVLRWYGNKDCTAMADEALAALSPAPSPQGAQAVDREPLRIDQTVTGAKGNCFSACLAMMLGLPISEVPNFCEVPGFDEDPGPAFRKAANEWLNARGWSHITMDAPGMVFRRYYSKGYVIAAGMTSRGFLHAVVYKDGELWHDPHPSHEGIQEVLEVDLLFPLRPFAPTPSETLTAPADLVRVARERDIWRGRVVDYTDVLASRFAGEISTEAAIKCLDAMAIEDCKRIADPDSSTLEVLLPIPRAPEGEKAPAPVEALEPYEPGKDLPGPYKRPAGVEDWGPNWPECVNCISRIFYAWKHCPDCGALNPKCPTARQAILRVPAPVEANPLRWSMGDLAIIEEAITHPKRGGFPEIGLKALTRLRDAIAKLPAPAPAPVERTRCDVCGWLLDDHSESGNPEAPMVCPNEAPEHLNNVLSAVADALPMPAENLGKTLPEAVATIVKYGVGRAREADEYREKLEALPTAPPLKDTPVEARDITEMDRWMRVKGKKFPAQVAAWERIKASIQPTGTATAPGPGLRECWALYHGEDLQFALAFVVDPEAVKPGWRYVRMREVAPPNPPEVREGET